MMIHSPIAYLNWHLLEDFAHNHRVTAALCGMAITGFGGVRMVKMLTRNKQGSAITAIPPINFGIGLFC